MTIYSGNPPSRGRTTAAVIGGCGRTGAAIAGALSDSGCMVRVFDVTPSAFDRLQTGPEPNGTIIPLLGDITLESHLRRAGTQDADVFIAVSGSDSSNIIAAQIALHILRVPVVICRLDDPVKRDLYDRLDLTTVSNTHMLRDLVVERL